jgi:hypothetical protein
MRYSFIKSFIALCVASILLITIGCSSIPDSDTSQQSQAATAGPAGITWSVGSTTGTVSGSAANDLTMTVNGDGSSSSPLDVSSYGLSSYQDSSGNTWLSVTGGPGGSDGAGSYLVQSASYNAVTNAVTLGIETSNGLVTMSIPNASSVLAGVASKWNIDQIIIAITKLCMPVTPICAWILGIITVIAAVCLGEILVYCHQCAHGCDSINISISIIPPGLNCTGHCGPGSKCGTGDIPCVITTDAQVLN